MRLTLRTAISFILFYVLVPSIFALTSIEAYVQKQANPDFSSTGSGVLYVLVPFYLYGGGSVHFFYTNQVFLRMGIVQDALRRILTWDLPCAIWIYSSLLVERIVFHRYDSSCVLIVITLS